MDNTAGKLLHKYFTQRVQNQAPTRSSSRSMVVWS